MSQLLIEIDSAENEAILLALLPKLDGRLIEKKETEVDKKKSFAQIANEIASRVASESQSAPESSGSPVDNLRKIAARGGATSFGDASEWQRETRQDRPLAGREE